MSDSPAINININVDEVSAIAKSFMAGHKFGCSEAVMLTFQPILPQYLPIEAVPMASAFRGGLGGAGCLCGALGAAEMVMGAVYGYKDGPGGHQNEETVARGRAMAKELHDRFKAEHQEVCCRLLTMGLPHGDPVRHERCVGLVGSAARILAELLNRGPA